MEKIIKALENLNEVLAEPYLTTANVYDIEGLVDFLLAELGLADEEIVQTEEGCLRLLSELAEQALNSAHRYSDGGLTSSFAEQASEQLLLKQEVLELACCWETLWNDDIAFEKH